MAWAVILARQNIKLALERFLISDSIHLIDSESQGLKHFKKRLVLSRALIQEHNNLARGLPREARNKRRQNPASAVLGEDRKNFGYARINAISNRNVIFFHVGKAMPQRGSENILSPLNLLITKLGFIFETH